LKNIYFNWAPKYPHFVLKTILAYSAFLLDLSSFWIFILVPLIYTNIYNTSKPGELRFIDILMSTAHMWSSSKWLLSAKFGAAFDRMSLEIILKSLLFSLINLWGSKRNEFSVSAVRFLDFGRCEECSG